MIRDPPTSRSLKRASIAAMPQYVAFLRAINVANRRVKMETLRNAFTALGFTNVSTFIASGNVIFESSALVGPLDEAEARIESQLKTALGFATETFLRTPAEIANVLAFQPFAAEDVDHPDHRRLVSFLRGAPDPMIAERVLDFRTATDDLRLQGRELHWLCRGPIHQSKVAWTRLDKVLGMPRTDRNITMLRQLASLPRAEG